jgi:hypothetical protein
LASSSENLNPSSSERKITPVDSWIAAARQDAEEVYKSAYNATPPNIEDKLWSYFQLHKDLEAIRKALPEVADQLRVRYVDYKKFYELGSPKNI